MESPHRPQKGTMTFLSILLVLVGSLLWLAFGIQSIYLLYIQKISSIQLFDNLLISNYSYQYLSGLFFAIEFLILIQIGSLSKDRFHYLEFLLNSLIWLVLGLCSFVFSVFLIEIISLLEGYLLPHELFPLFQASSPFIIIYCALFVLIFFFRFTRNYESKVPDLSPEDKIKLGLLFLLLGLIGGTLAGVLVLIGSLIMIFDTVNQKFLFHRVQNYISFKE